MRITNRLVRALRAFSRVCAATILSLLATLAAWGAVLPPPL